MKVAQLVYGEKIVTLENMQETELEQLDNQFQSSERKTFKREVNDTVQYFNLENVNYIVVAEKEEKNEAEV